MLNLRNIPNGEISGLSSEVLEWVTSESGDRYVEELSHGFLTYLNSEDDLSEVPQDVMDELNEIEKEGIPHSSMRQMTENVKRFSDFLIGKNLSTDLKNIPIAILKDYLRFFYSCLRTKDNMFYAPASLICIRAALHRYFMLNRPDVNIIGDIRFAQANRMLVSMVRKFKSSGQPKRSTTFPAIEKADLIKLMTYFDRTNGEVLQQEVMFHLIYHFGFRGRETLPQLSKSSFRVTRDSDGKKYVCLNHELLSKNSKASLKTKEHEDFKQSRMYASDNSGDSNCPVAAFELYMNKIEHLNSLFPKSCKLLSKRKTSNQWYVEKQTVGKNTIDVLMSNMSAKLSLSKRYTNHSIRVTHITVLKENGFSNSEIARNTGHKNVESIERYNRKRRDVDFAGMSSALTLETTKASHNITVRSIGPKRNKVVLEETIHDDGNQNVSSTINVHFSGNYQNCTFNVDKL